MPGRGLKPGSQEAHLVATIGAQSRWSAEPNRTAATQPMRDGLRASKRRQVLAESPGLTDETEINRRIDAKLKAQLALAQLKSLQSRRAKKEAREQAEADAMADAILSESGADDSETAA